MNFGLLSSILLTIVSKSGPPTKTPTKQRETFHLPSIFFASPPPPGPQTNWKASGRWGPQKTMKTDRFVPNVTFIPPIIGHLKRCVFNGYFRRPTERREISCNRAVGRLRELLPTIPNFSRVFRKVVPPTPQQKLLFILYTASPPSGRHNQIRGNLPHDLRKINTLRKLLTSHAKITFVRF